MELFDYQKEAVEFIGRNKKVYLALDMGMGKTITALAAADCFAKKNILVIAEKNEIVNSQNFRREAELLNMEYISLREEGIPDTYPDKFYVCGVNPDALVKFNPDLIAKLFDFVIIDEATLAKTTTTQRFKRVRKICDMMEYVVLLSGTPMMNGAAELFAPLLLLGHSLAGDGTAKAREAFETIFAGGHRRKIRNTGVWFKDYVWWAKGANHVRELRYLIQDKFFFKRKEDSTVFHKKVRRIKRVPMSMEWIAEYRSAWEDYLKDASAREVDMNNIVDLQRLIENGQCYQVNSKHKTPLVVQDIADSVYGDRRVIIFTMFIDSFDRVCAELEARNISYKTFERVQDWKSSDDRVLVGRIKAHGKGGNVPEASVCLFVDMDFVPANNVQAENRIDRPEQKRDMDVVYYMSENTETVDDHVRRVVQDKTRKIEEFMRPLAQDEEVALSTIREKYAKAARQLGI